MKLTAAFVIATALLATPASALTFDFTITGQIGVPPPGAGFVPGAASGVISGLTPGLSSATGLTITQFPNLNPGLAYIETTFGPSTINYPPADVLGQWPAPSQNQFNVQSNAITQADFRSDNGLWFVQLLFDPNLGNQGIIQYGPSCNCTENTELIGTISFAEVTPDTGTTPLPAALPMFMGGAGLFGLLARRKKRKSCSAALAA